MFGGLFNVKHTQMSSMPPKHLKICIDMSVQVLVGDLLFAIKSSDGFPCLMLNTIFSNQVIRWLFTDKNCHYCLAAE